MRRHSVGVHRLAVVIGAVAPVVLYLAITFSEGRPTNPGVRGFVFLAVVGLVSYAVVRIAVIAWYWVVEGFRRDHQ
jgi:drug/metabolite transporter (DMT)-like permease